MLCSGKEGDSNKQNLSQMDARLPVAPDTSAEGQEGLVEGVGTYLLLVVASLGLAFWAASSWVASRSKRAAALHSLGTIPFILMYI